MELSGDLSAFIDVLIDPDVAKRFQNAAAAKGELSTLNVDTGKRAYISPPEDVREIMTDSDVKEFVESVKESDPDLFDPRYR